jgi:3-deoxy-D-manno-octulosonate 8-phosphate phosphatase (KDO 8-P phosphatase)
MPKFTGPYGENAMKEKLKPIKMILMDVDGVMTGGEIIYSSSGEELKVFNIHDGMGMAMARMAGLKTGIITSRMSEMVRRRAEELKVDAVVQGQINKLAAYEEIKARFNLTDADIAYIGDDLVDLCILKRVGFSAAVADARQAVKIASDYVTAAGGGRGAVREVVDLILESQDKLDRLVAQFSL